jgi:phage terminase large subunit
MAAADIIRACQANPEFFLKNVLGVTTLTEQLSRVCASVKENRRTAVPSGHGVGKTYLSARLALWRLYSFPPSSKVITTAPTWEQVEKLLWRELRNAHKTSVTPLGGNLLKTELTIDEDWFAVGLSTNEPVRFQGHHAPYVTVILDEATGVDPLIWEAAEGLAVGPNDRFLAVGNPTDPTAEFKRACDSPLWNVVRLNAEEHPNVLSGEILIPGAVTREWVEEKKIQYGGTDTALYRARVLGLFPEQGDDMLISLAWVERAQKNWRKPEYDDVAAAQGTDVARFGSDETVHIDIFEDGSVGVPRAIRGQNTMATAGAIKASSARRKGVDDSGLGGGVTDRLVEQGVDIIPYIAGESPFDKERFYNRRAETWWEVREMLRLQRMTLPPDDQLAADLTNIKFSYTSKGQIKLEKKEEVKKRLGRSPDRGDALAIALYARDLPVFDVSDDERDVFATLAFGR